MTQVLVYYFLKNWYRYGWRKFTKKNFLIRLRTGKTLRSKKFNFVTLGHLTIICLNLLVLFSYPQTVRLKPRDEQLWRIYFELSAVTFRLFGIIWRLSRSVSPLISNSSRIHRELFIQISLTDDIDLPIYDTSRPETQPSYKWKIPLILPCVWGFCFSVNLISAKVNN